MDLKFEYVDITTPGCEGWINLFFGGHCLTMVADKDIAANIKAVTPKMERGDADTCSACLGEGFGAVGDRPGQPCGTCGATGQTQSPKQE